MFLSQRDPHGRETCPEKECEIIYDLALEIIYDLGPKVIYE